MVDKLFNFFLVRYGKLWAERYANLGLTMTQVKQEWELELRQMTPEELEKGISACRTKTFPPTLPEFVKMCVAGHPGADEAWGIALKAMDEDQTVIWTKEIMQAWDRCRIIYEDGDKVGARVAFKSAYDSLDLSGRPDWIVSEGHDQQRRAVEMQSAQVAGRLTMSEQPKLLASGVTSSSARSRAIEKLRALSAELERKQGAFVADVNPDIPRTDELKRASAEKVAQYQKSRGGF